jgi:uncharacterized damage-inducible protein DinB
MNNKLSKPLIAQLELQTELFRKVIIDISELEANEKVDEQINSIKWIAGHIVNTRMTLISILSGKKQDADFNSLFGKGTSQLTNKTYPLMDEIIGKWNLVSEELIAEIGKASDEQLLSKPPFQTSIPDSTLNGLIAFIVSHEANHTGQISILRKLNASKITLYDAVICN